ncbi:metal ABC transporter ATP-binding protein [Deinococcus multiflagellatus]|uniref:Metal ABC transporter ATP-binding protein n=1 Tax=Deinococcus multiflagellatus TaxID=1656887 RepID=A0ABW1ZJG8_9DEIO|nr:metal ABC transporter ATP-binding protein [Deinococcus multiflagellatus]MBZ9711854.1 metal ABC transporter ATP-binding protein [Deinococcus multiflagellatus]
MSPHALDIHDLSVAYGGGRLALRHATLTVQEGSICGLIGMNGTGKSTLFKAAMGFLPPITGQIQVFGQPMRAAQRQGLIAYVPQSEDVDWDFPVSVGDVVMMGRQGRMGFLRRPSVRDRDMVHDALTRVGMAAFAGRQIGELSGGQKKRAFLARALAQEARLLLLDEPFGGVDVGTSEAIIALLRDLRRAGCSVLVSTHDLDSLQEFCDHVAFVGERTVLAFGPTATTFTPQNLARAFGGRQHQPAAPARLEVGA